MFLMYSPLSCHFTKFYCQTKNLCSIYSACLSPFFPNFSNCFPCIDDAHGISQPRLSIGFNQQLKFDAFPNFKLHWKSWTAMKCHFWFVLLPLFIWVSCWLTDHQFMGFFFKGVPNQVVETCGKYQWPGRAKLCWGTAVPEDLLEHGTRMASFIYIYTLWIQTPPEKVLNPPNHVPNTS